MTPLQIDRDVPLPASSRGNGAPMLPLTITLMAMKQGNSVLVQKAQSVASSSTIYAAKKTGRKFTTRKVEGGTRIWCVSAPDADPAPLTEAGLREMMNDPRYWQTREPEFVAHVTEAFRRLVSA